MRRHPWRHRLWGHTSVRKVYHVYDAQRWAARGFWGPPPHPFKVATVCKYAGLGYQTFIETGTNYGDMLVSVLGYFEQCISIEADPVLYRLVRSRVAKSPNAKVYHGDSATVLSSVLPEVREAAVFWLDAHPEPGEIGAVPLMEEVRSIVEHPVRGHAVLIDDAHMIGTSAWPSLSELEQLVLSSGRLRRMGLDNDIIRIALD